MAEAVPQIVVVMYCIACLFSNQRRVGGSAHTDLLASGIKNDHSGALCAAVNTYHIFFIHYSLPLIAFVSIYASFPENWSPALKN